MGIFVNADLIEKELRDNGSFDFKSYKLDFNYKFFIDNFKASSFFASANGLFLLEKLSNKGSSVCISDTSSLNSYFAAYIADYSREQLLLSGKKFTVETVLSDVRKLDFMRSAKEKGYRVYLYFITTCDPLINIQRVNARVNQKGHSVPEDKISSRYHKSLNNLFTAMLISDRAYIFDNSYKEPNFIAEKKDNFIENKKDFVPEWYQKYVIEKLKKAYN
nr:zeta toxin family protein [uncultured Bacteroides sp.]